LPNGPRERLKFESLSLLHLPARCGVAQPQSPHTVQQRETCNTGGRRNSFRLRHYSDFRGSIQPKDHLFGAVGTKPKIFCLLRTRNTLERFAFKPEKRPFLEIAKRRSTRWVSTLREQAQLLAGWLRFGPQYPLILVLNANNSQKSSGPAS
jgi:hypothetical protein